MHTVARKALESRWQWWVEAAGPGCSSGGKIQAHNLRHARIHMHSFEDTLRVPQIRCSFLNALFIIEEAKTN